MINQYDNPQQREFDQKRSEDIAELEGKVLNANLKTTGKFLKIIGYGAVLPGAAYMATLFGIDNVIDNYPISLLATMAAGTLAINTETAKKYGQWVMKGSPGKELDRAIEKEDDLKAKLNSLK